MSQSDGALQVDEAAASAAFRLLAFRLGASIATKVALGFRASGRLLAGPRALGRRASGPAIWNGRSADGLALGGHANVLAQRATGVLAVLA